VTAQLGVLGETAPRAVELGLYLHVPFCAKRCFYCSFNTAPMNGAVMARYVRAVEREILLLGQAPWSRRVTLASVFLGGGTPSLLSPEDLATILATLRDSLAVAPEVEVTVECNPESVTRAKLGAYRTAGVNRISLGVQSLDESLLARLGRGHAACDARAAFAAARAAGFENISIDLMYGLPGLDLDGWSRVIATTLDWEPEHLSAYGLTLDPGSLWGAQGAPRLPRGRRGRTVLGARADGRSEGLRALRDLQLRPSGLPVAAQPDLLAGRRIPRRRPRRLRIHR
jgi:oxygen-independent coproporphyrinogen-3 oxidase